MRIRSLTLRLLSLALVILALSAASFGQFRVAITFGPPAIPVYEQPICPGDGYIWTPGYWYWDDDIQDYYWVPGTWVLAPEVGFLWTPGWWGWGGDVFAWHEGFWGPTVGFYGGINYGFGYFGVGFVGGRWDHDHFFYNREVMNVNVTEIHNVYNERVTVNNVNRVSFNGGEGGINARPTPQEEAAARERHVPPIAAQTQHVQAARGNPQLRASMNHGKPPIAATARPGEFSGRGVAEAKEAGAPYTPRNPGGAPRGGSPAGGSPAVHPKDLPPVQRPAAPNTGDPKLDKKYQQQQEKLASQQEKDRQKLQQQQEKEHQQLEKQQADTARKQQVEQKHQQQTQQLQEKHSTQMQHLQTRQAPPARPRK